MSALSPLLEGEILTVSLGLRVENVIQAAAGSFAGRRCDRMRWAAPLQGSKCPEASVMPILQGSNELHPRKYSYKIDGTSFRKYFRNFDLQQIPRARQADTLFQLYQANLYRLFPCLSRWSVGNQSRFDVKNHKAKHEMLVNVIFILFTILLDDDKISAVEIPGVW